MFNIFFKESFKDTDNIEVSRDGQPSSVQPLSKLFSYISSKLFNTTNVATEVAGAVETSGYSGKAIFEFAPAANQRLSVFISNPLITPDSNIIFSVPKYYGLGIGNVTLSCYYPQIGFAELILENSTGDDAVGIIEIFYLILE